MELVIVHLTDIHIKDDADFDMIFERTTSLGGAICNHITEPESTAVLFCITGDLAFSGQVNQYTAVELVLEEIFSLIKRRFPKIDIHTIFVPGNHDCDFNNEIDSVRDALLTSPTLDITDTSHLKVCTGIKKNFFNFVSEWNQKYKTMSCMNDKILTINELNWNEENVRLKFHCINTSWCSKCHEEKGKMKIVKLDCNAEDILGKRTLKWIYEKYPDLLKEYERIIKEHDFSYFSAIEKAYAENERVKKFPFQLTD